MKLPQEHQNHIVNKYTIFRLLKCQWPVPYKIDFACHRMGQEQEALEDPSEGKHIDSDYEEELRDLKVLNIASTQQKGGDAQHATKNYTTERKIHAESVKINQQEVII